MDGVYFKMFIFKGIRDINSMSDSLICVWNLSGWEWVDVFSPLYKDPDFLFSAGVMFCLMKGPLEGVAFDELIFCEKSHAYVMKFFLDLSAFIWPSLSCALLSVRLHPFI